MIIKVNNDKNPNLQLTNYNVETPKGNVNIVATDEIDAETKAHKLLNEEESEYKWIGNIKVPGEEGDYTIKTYKIKVDDREDAENHLNQFILMQQKEEDGWDNAKVDSVDPISESIVRIYKRS